MAPSHLPKLTPFVWGLKNFPTSLWDRGGEVGCHQGQNQGKTGVLTCQTVWSGGHLLTCDSLGNLARLCQLESLGLSPGPKPLLLI
jgi:hypothetical protein